MKHRAIVITLLTTSLLALVGFGCKGGDPAAQQAASRTVNLTWWRIEGTENDVKPLIDSYKTSRSNVNVQVRIVRREELQQLLLEALASGRGPDIVSLPNTLVHGWQERLTPLPASTTIPVQEYQGTIKRELKWALNTKSALSLGELKSLYIDTVLDDAMIGGQVYGLPLSMDSLMMFYNVDLLSAAQFAEAPKTWTEFKNAVQNITKLDTKGRIIQNGAGLGEADNITYAPDILSALMLQNGTQMTNAEGTRAAFGEPVTVGGQTYTPGADALRFYTDFANPTKETYTWSAEEQNDQQAFATGKVGFIFGYWRDLESLRLRSPKVRLGVARFPQIDGTSAPTYLANYILETVTKQSQYQDQAWDFLQYIAKPEVAKLYVDGRGVPAAHRSLVTGQLSNLDLMAPAGQVLTAKTWYHGYKPDTADGAFRAMIRQVQQGGKLDEALYFAVRTIDPTLKLQSP
jgi:ABC-type glycerol-3-phosphate transport system substrate-binding protein